MQGSKRNRSRSPMRMDAIGRRRDHKMDGAKSMNNTSSGGSSNTDMNMMNMNQMMTQMSQYGNMMMGGMYPNMMMQGAMMGGGMMPTGTNMDMMTTTGMDMVTQNIDMSSMATGSMATGSMGTGTMATGSMATAPMTTPMSATPLAPTGTMDMNMMGGMMMDPSMLGMYQGMSGGDNMSVTQENKEIILKHCKLTPPESGTALPPRRARPPGCRTIFVGGLPDKIRESIVREIFENYGRIHTLRLSKKNFCHIRFDRENCVDAAMGISGYRIKLTDNKEKDNDDMDEDDDSHATTGWLHVDFAASRDDQNEYERRQRQAMRLQQQQLEQFTAQQDIPGQTLGAMVPEYRRSPSPVRVQPYSNTAVIQLSEKIKNEEHFSSALPTLLSWLERGECSKKNANQFYSMIQATNSHIRRLFNEKMQSEEELQECKERVKNNIENVITQLEQVAKVLNAAAHQRVWDHFTKPQRKNIETWQKMTQEFNSLKEEFNEKFYSEENEFNGFNNRPLDSGGSSEEVQQLKCENESLKFQLEAYKNEVDVIKADAQKEMEKFKAQFIARQALQGAMQGAVDKNPPLPSKPVVKPPPPPPLPEDNKVNLKESIEVECGEAKLIGVMSAFLQVHPQGASLDYVVSYVRALFPQVSQATVHHVLQKHIDVFQSNTSGVGANIENRWSFIAFSVTKKEETA